MKINLTNLISWLWMGVIAYMLYIMLEDVQYITKLIHAYMEMIMEIARY